ncbi:hypothetical protein FKM82_009870 [Ascaphus truei]
MYSLDKKIKELTLRSFLYGLFMPVTHIFTLQMKIAVGGSSGPLTACTRPRTEWWATSSIYFYLLQYMNIFLVFVSFLIC